MPIYEVTLEVEEAVGEDASAELFELGAEAVETRDRDGLKLPGVELPPEGKTWVIAGFEATDPEALTAEVLAGLSMWGAKLHALRLRDDTDWAHKWKEFFKPLRVGDRLWVSPSWETAPDAKDAVIITLDPEMAFGTGQHPTTRLCLKAVERYADATGKSFSDKRVLDVGTGSGILAIGAALLGAKHLVAFDNDEVSVDTAKVNAERNKVGFIHFFVGAMPEAKDELKGTFDLVLANILADPLIEMSGSLSSLLSPGGTLVLSGLMLDQAERVGAAYVAQGKRLVLREDEGEWSALVFE